jgi:hypothetical protein
MEAREEAEQASDPAHLRHMLSANRERQRGLFYALAQALDQDELQEAKDRAIDLIYLQKLEEVVMSKLPGHE